jgi:glycosyltransferase involved in cell wall biosynthesis
MKFSIVICTHNAAERLPKTFDSLLAQTFGDFEVVAIDGASTDGTQDVIQKYEEKFGGRLRWFSEKDSGVYEAMNRGVKMAKGEYLNIVGAGDWLEPDALEEAAKCADLHPEADAVFGKTRVWDKDKKASRLVQTSPEQLPNHPMQHPSLFYKKTLHDKFGFYDENYRIAADYAFCLKVFCLGKAKTQPFDAVVDNYIMGGMSSAKPGLCLKENWRARREAGISRRASFREAIAAAKDNIKKLFQK